MQLLLPNLFNVHRIGSFYQIVWYRCKLTKCHLSEDWESSTVVSVMCVHKAIALMNRLLTLLICHSLSSQNLIMKQIDYSFTVY